MDVTTIKKRAWLYLRVSTSRQAEKNGEREGYSIPAQRDVCSRKAASLGAEVVQEFVDAGASARSADRPALQQMLLALKQGPVDYVIVHKIDRLARDRADDVSIALAIRAAGATLVSASENIDDTPQGLLLHGIMSSIAEFYSSNLSLEAKKGLHEKAKRGGTPAYAPLGYLHTTTRVDGREVKTVIVDEDRAHHIRWAFEAYATGQWSVVEITEELERRGLKTRTSRRYVGSPLSRSAVHRTLSNPYYIGIVEYGGVQYPGKHEPTIDEETFQQVQKVLENRRLAGDRSWRRHQYLKGSAFCARCGERLGYGHSTGKGGEYAYFFCLGRHRKRTDCTLPYTGAGKVEAAFVELWDGLTFTDKFVAVVGEAVDEVFGRMQEEQQQTLVRERARQAALERQKQKLIDAYLADAIPVEDLKPRQAAVQEELVEVRRRIEEASSNRASLKRHVRESLELLRQAGQLYRRSDDHSRQSLNQVFFDRAYIDVDEDGFVRVVSVEVKDEFRALIELAGQVARSRADDGLLPVDALLDWDDGWLRALPRCRVGDRAGWREQRPAALRELVGVGAVNQENPGQQVAAQGSNLTHLAERVGFEPTDP